MTNGNGVTCDKLTNVVIIDLNVFSASMKYGILREGKSTNIIAKQERRFEEEEVKILEQRTQPCDFSSCVREGTILTFDREACNGVVDRLSIGQPAQSASEKAVRVMEPLVKDRPCCGVPLRYRKMRLASPYKGTIGGRILNKVTRGCVKLNG
ncbi:unnamed protein product [Prunus armeniaca]